ncbi:MAG TPA: gamma-glutamylcyclotransferase [Chitinophagaceae bacterium]|nr:gamma-glutamylcyclotransferase [Chitinophagaceae bacterium]
MPELLFSYGTLQLEKVQLESFGRILKGEKDSFSSYKLISLEIKDPKVLEQSQQKFHPIAVYTGNRQDTIEGVVFEISKEELAKADAYEVDDYKRIEVKLDSGKKAWVYVSKDNA